VVEDAKSQIEDSELEIVGGASIEDVQACFASGAQVDHVFMGTGIDVEKRLDIAREIFQISGAITVHLKDASSEPQGFLPFVKAVLEGLKMRTEKSG
jgi:hypothetical protein